MSLFLKMATDKLFPISNGTAFHSVGATTEKDLAPYCFQVIVHVLSHDLVRFASRMYGSPLSNSFTSV